MKKLYNKIVNLTDKQLMCLIVAMAGITYLLITILFYLTFFANAPKV